jgi:GNAT superfamily N-acetyltransferase
MMHALPATDELYRGMGRMVVRFYCRTPGSICVVASHAILGCSGLDSVFLNCGVVFGEPPGGDDPADGRLREFVGLIRARGVGGYVCLSESVLRRLEPLARGLDLEPLPPIPLMAREAGPMPFAGAAGTPGDDASRPALDPAAFAVERVISAAGLAEFLAVSEAAFGLPVDLYGKIVTPDLLRDPALHVFLCRMEGAPVAGVCVVAEEGIAGISGLATLPDLQGRGLGGHLLDRVMEACRPGTHAFYLTASEPGRRLYRRHGFTTVDAATAWVVAPPGG